MKRKNILIVLILLILLIPLVFLFKQIILSKKQTHTANSEHIRINLAPKNYERYPSPLSPDSHVNVDANNQTHSSSQVNWEGMLTEKLLRHLDPATTQIQISEKTLFIAKSGNKTKQIAHVLISITQKDASPTTFRASVDTTNGKIIATWGRTIKN